MSCSALLPKSSVPAMGANLNLAVIKNQPDFDEAKLDNFMEGIEALREEGTWTKDDIVKLYFELLPKFAHKETNKYLDQRM